MTYNPHRLQQVAGADTAAADNPVDEAAALGKAAATAARVCAVIVTYGDRFRLVRQVIEAGFACGVKKAIVVDNNSVPASRQALEILAQGSSGSVDVVRLPENLGSAGGYKAGIERALQCEFCDYIWLLDDDNAPEPDALVALLQHHKELSHHRPQDCFALASWRQSRKRELLACGVPPRLIFPPRSSFHKYHVLHRVLRLGCVFFMLRRIVNPDIRSTKPISIPYTPYGGLFVHKSVLFTIGVPDDRLFLYVDDFEYTNRLVRNGGAIFLICSSIVRDIEPSWVRRTSRPRAVTADCDMRAYHLVRNWAYFDSYYWMDSRLMYTVNKYAFLTALLLHVLVRGRWRRFRMILRAVRDGEMKRFTGVDRFASAGES